MIQSNKMIYQPPKYHHSNSFSHFLQLHSSINANNNNCTNSNNPIANSNRVHTDDEQIDSKLDINDDGTSNASNTSLEVVNDSVGKSFTIAAILGLKKNSALHSRGQHGHCDLDENSSVLNDYNSEFRSSIINLTTAHSKLFQKFDNNDNHRHNYMLSTAASSEHSQMPSMEQQQCNMYDNNTTSNSSYQEHPHLHKQQQQHINTEFNVNYNRNSDDAPTNPAMRNHLHHHQHHASATNLLNKAFHRERSGGGSGGRMDHFPSKTKSSMSLKNKRVRTIFTPEQLERLEAEFERQQYMVGPERLYLAHTLQLTEAQVKVWFQNRRIKWRKHHLEITQQHLAIARQRQLPLPPIPSTSKEEDSVHSDGHIVSDADD